MNRFILTEDEKRHISNLHKNYITEQVATDNVIQPGVFNQKVQDLQNHLINTFSSKIVADGKLGPKTLGAAQAAYLSKTKQPTTPAQTTQPSQPAATTPEISTSDLARYGLKPAQDYFSNGSPTNSPNGLPNSL